jgi:uncharacterized protein YegP (UPF0339 family)
MIVIRHNKNYGYDFVIKAPNGQIMAVSEKHYSKVKYCRRAIDSVLKALNSKNGDITFQE